MAKILTEIVTYFQNLPKRLFFRPTHSSHFHGVKPTFYSLDHTLPSFILPSEISLGTTTKATLVWFAAITPLLMLLKPHRNDSPTSTNPVLYQSRFDRYLEKISVKDIKDTFGKTDNWYRYNPMDIISVLQYATGIQYQDPAGPLVAEMKKNHFQTDPSKRNPITKNFHPLMREDRNTLRTMLPPQPPGPETFGCRPTIVVDLDALAVKYEDPETGLPIMAKRVGCDFFLGKLALVADIVIHANETYQVSNPLLEFADTERRAFWRLYYEDGITFGKQGHLAYNLPNLNRYTEGVLCITVDPDRGILLPTNTLQVNKLDPLKNDTDLMDLLTTLYPMIYNIRNGVPVQLLLSRSRDLDIAARNRDQKFHDMEYQLWSESVIEQRLLDIEFKNTRADVPIYQP